MPCYPVTSMPLANFMLHATGIIWSLLHEPPLRWSRAVRVHLCVFQYIPVSLLSVFQTASNKRTRQWRKLGWKEKKHKKMMRVQVEHGTVGNRNREKYLALERATEQMATPRRQDHNRDVTTLGLKSPPEHKGTCTHAQWHKSRSFSLLSAFVRNPGSVFASLKGCFFFFWAQIIITVINPLTLYENSDYIWKYDSN